MKKSFFMLAILAVIAILLLASCGSKSNKGDADADNGIENGGTEDTGTEDSGSGDSGSEDSGSGADVSGKWSKGLEYSLAWNGKSYAVSGIGECTDRNIVIPTSYNGLPVTKIEKEAFKYAHNIISVVIGENVTAIGGRAFYGCNSLLSVTLPNSLETIDSEAFRLCRKLVEIINHSALQIQIDSSDSTHGYIGNCAKTVHQGESGIVVKGDFIFYEYDGINYLMVYTGTETSPALPESYNGENYELHSHAFYANKEIKTIYIPNSVTAIGVGAFQNCEALTFVKIGSGVVSVASEAFRKCYSLAGIVVPKSLSTMGEYCFYQTDGVESVYYEGNTEEWNKIGFEPNNAELTGATRYYYSETAPEASGLFWHYNENGEAVAWE